MAKLLVILLT